MFEAIQAGNFPEWEFAVQLFTQEQADRFPFDHLDATKLIPEELVPLRVIGRMVLDRWPDNFFAETEQVAYCPANIVPGIDFSDDPLLAGTPLLLSRHAAFAPRFRQFSSDPDQCAKVPVGKPAAGRSHANGAAGRRASPTTPTRSPKTRRAKRQPGGSAALPLKRNGREDPPPRRELCRPLQPGAPLLSQPNRLRAGAYRLGAGLRAFQGGHLHVREAMVGHLRHIDEDLATRVAKGLALDKMPDPPAAAAPVRDMPLSPALQIIGRMKDDARQAARVGILVADGSDGAAIEKIEEGRDRRGRSGEDRRSQGGRRKACGRTMLACDGQLAGTPSVLFDAVAVILSEEGAKMLSMESAAIDFVRDAFGHLKAIAVDSGGRELLKTANVGEDAGVVDAANKDAFIAAAKTRQWDREKAVRILA